MIIFFEGLPGSGKTTLAKHFSRMLGAEIVYEILERGKSWKRARVLENQMFFWKNDLDKARKARNSKNHVFVDRSYVSTLGYNYSKWVLGRQSDFSKLLSLYFTDVVRKNLRPDAYIYFALPVEFCNKRKKRNSKQNNPMQDARFLEKMRIFYDFFFRVFEPDIPVFRINASASTTSVRIQTKKALLSMLKKVG